MKPDLLHLFAVCLVALLPHSDSIGQPLRQKICLHEGWKFALGHAGNPQLDYGCGTEYFNYLTKANSIHNEGPYSPQYNDSLWQPVNLPHDWAASLPYHSQASHSHGYKTVGYQYPETSVGWYRKTLYIPANDEGRYIGLQFDGIYRNAQVWFNGIYMGTEPSGYATQVYDVTEYVHYGADNVICVRADATLQEGWYYEGAGIYRDVWLLKASAVSVAPFGTCVTAQLDAPFQQATLTVQTQVSNHSLQPQTCTVQQLLVDAQGRTVATAPQQSLSLQAKQTLPVQHTLSVAHPQLWSPDHPYLYHVETQVNVGSQPADIYQTPIGLRHIAFTADSGFLLNGQPFKLRGVNMHQDHAGVGVAVPDALQAWRLKQLKALGCNAYRSAHHPMSPALLDLCDQLGMLVIEENRLSGINTEHLRLLENMIRRDRNHPSIILWSNGNEEWGLENTRQGTLIAAAMQAYTRQLDPTRPSTMANAGGSELIKGLEVVGYNYIVQNDVDNRRQAHPEWKIVGTEETTGCGTRGVYFNSPSQPGHMASLNRSTSPGVENVIERGWQFYYDRPWAAGLFYWTGFDYRGEPNPLSYPAHDSEFGLCDYCGHPKDEAWYLKAWWTSQPVLHLFPHWNLHGHEGEEVEVWAYSNCQEVELLLNGQSLGRQTMPRNGHLKWTTRYQPGRLEAFGYNQGQCILSDILCTTQPASSIGLSADRTRLQADGRDLCVVSVRLYDAQHQFVPDACPLLTFTLQGEGRILGVGNGDPAYLGPDHSDQLNCHSFSLPAFNGLAQVLVQSSSTPSTLRLQASSPGLQGAEVIIQTER